MNEKDMKERVVCLFYTLARDHLAYGVLNDTIRDRVGTCSNFVFSSEGAEMLARKMTAELFAEDEGIPT